MNDRKKHIKLFTWRQGVMIALALCGGAALAVWRSYARKGYINKVDMVSVIIAMIMCSGICWYVAWWGNKPEKEE